MSAYNKKIIRYTSPEYEVAYSVKRNSQCS